MATNRNRERLATRGKRVVGTELEAYVSKCRRLDCYRVDIDNFVRRRARLLCIDQSCAP